MSSFDYFKYLQISHKNLPFYHPLSPQKFADALNVLPLKPKQRIIDFGGGKGEFLIKLIEQYNVHGTLVEQSVGPGHEAKRVAKGRISLKNIEICLEGTKKYLQKNPDQKFSLAACINSVAFGPSYKKMLAGTQQVLLPGGLIVLGTPYWIKKPSRGFLKALKIAESDIGYFPQIIEAAEKRGLVPLWMTLANQDEIDRYQWMMTSSVENHVQDFPNDPDSERLSAIVKANRRIYLKWGRSTWGFGLFIFRNKA